MYTKIVIQKPLGILVTFSKELPNGGRYFNIHFGEACLELELEGTAFSELLQAIAERTEEKE